MSGTFSWTHLLIIALLFVVLFGAKRLPDAARGLGRSLRIFKSEVSQMQKEETPSTAPTPPPAQPLPPGQSAAEPVPPQPQQKSA
ncbi:MULTISPECIES: Sec-independent protein translocase subunit TatA [Nocardia]|uniref:Sec-independent protein translocase protein TatA n=1 Tax=Nocardia aurea TaxID=2144174 RepID=A0ABV3G5P8_9NOCA|nr:MULTISPECIES: Sec-independent protein translocase subunit TatA [Nocardia]